MNADQPNNQAGSNHGSAVRGTAGRTKRIIIGSVIPPVLGGLIVWLDITFTPLIHSYGMGTLGALQSIFQCCALIIISTIIFVIPSLIYSLVMEFVVQRIDNNVFVVGASMLLGACVAGSSEMGSSIIGAVVGLLVGYYLRNNFKSNK